MSSKKSTNKKSLYLASVIWLFFSLFVAFFEWGEINVLERPDIIYNTYNDSISKGFSKCKIVSTSPSIKYQCIIKDGAEYPYSGINLVFEPLINLKSNDVLKLQLITKKKAKIHVSFFGKTINGNNLRKDEYVYCEKGKNELKLNLSDFTSPDWWIEENHPIDSILKENIDQIEVISFSHNYETPIDVSEEIEITKIKFSNPNWEIKLSLILGLGLILIVLYVINSKKNKNIVLKYQSVDASEVEPINLEDKNLKDIVEFISKNYQESDLTLRIIRKQLKITENNISQIIKKHFNLSFNDYVNNIRLAEAKRLLLSSKLNINEIADLTGFGSISSFNRIFKNSIGMSPTEFRNSTVNDAN